MTDLRKAREIRQVLDAYLAREGLQEISAVDAAKVLDRTGLLADSADRPGLPLRRYLRAGLIERASQEPNGRWFIRR